MRKPQYAELTERLASDAVEALDVIHEANKDLVERSEKLGLSLDYDDDADILTITIGERPIDFYTQGLGSVYLDLDLETDKLVGFTIHEFQAAYVKTKAGRRMFKAMNLTLVAYGSFNFPPDSKGTQKVAEGFRELVPA